MSPLLLPLVALLLVLASWQSSQITVIDFATRAILHRIAPGTEPDGMA